MPARIGLRRLLMLVCALFIGTSATLFSAAPASASHVVTNCNNDASGMDEIFFEWNDIVFVGVDTGLGDLLGPESRAVCVAVFTTVASVVVDFGNAPLGYAGRTIRVRLCTTSCTTLLGPTGVFVNLSAPLFSCIYLNGTQQNPGCPL